MIIYILYIILSPIIWILLLVSTILNKKIRLRFFSYKKLFHHTANQANLTNKKIILFHAASNGELEQLKPFFREINRDKYYILLTISSPSCISSINKEEIDSFCYQAFDFPWTVYRFLEKIKPAKYIVTRHDLWPNHIIIAKLLNIESYLINANLPKSSKRKWPILRLLYGFVLKKIHTIYTVSNRLGNRLEKIINNNSNIKVIGDTRFDQIQFRKNNTLNNNSPLKGYEQSENILFGSIENKDISIIFDSLIKIKEKIETRNINLIFVPHELESNILSNIEYKLKELGMESMRYSNMNKNNMKLSYNKAIIVDSIGILADLYRYSSIAYIGCGFSKGVHNVAEPAIYGNTICFGPKFDILNEAIEMVDQSIAYSINNKDELTDILSMVFNKEKLNQNAKKVQKYIELKLNVTKIIINEIF